MHENNPTSPPTNLERNTRYAVTKPDESKTINKTVRVTFHSLRRRLADSDGISGKAALDGLVESGILANDSPKEVESVTFTQEKTDDAEKTIITIEEIAPHE